MFVASKKKTFLVVLIIVLAVAALAVGISFAAFFHSNRSKEPDYTPAQITQQIIAELQYTDITQVQQDQLIKHYSNLDDVLQDFSLYMSKSANQSFELACFELKDSADFPALEESVAEHISTKAQGFKELSPTEYEKIQNYRMERKGRMVLLVIGNDADAAIKIFFSMA